MKTRNTEESQAQKNLPICSPLNAIAEFEFQLVSLSLKQVELTNSIKSNPELAEELDLVQSKITIMKESIKRLSAFTDQFSSSKAPVQNFPTNLPKLQPPSKMNNFDVNDFIQTFEAILRGSCVDETHWTAALFSSVEAGDQTTLIWMNGNISNCSWSTAKEQLKKYFSNVDLQRHYEKQFSNIKCDSNETIFRFAARFSHVVTKANRDINHVSVLDKFISALPYTIQNHLINKAIDITSLDELTACAIKIENLLSSIRPSESYVSSNQNNFMCNYCGRSGHLEEYCRVKKETSENSNSHMRNADKNLTQCVSNPPERKSTDQKNTKPLINNNPNSFYLCSSESPYDDSRIFITVLIQNIKFHSLIDTGSERSLISCQSFNKLKDVDLKTSSTLLLGIKNDVPSHPIGETDELSVSADGRQISLKFLVDNIPSNIDILLGMDAINQLGIVIGNLPHVISSTQDIVDVSVELEEETQFLRKQIPHQHQEYVMDQIQEVLRLNGVTMNKFCSHPLSTVFLPTPDGKTSFIKQYRIPMRLQCAVDVTIKKWLENGSNSNCSVKFRLEFSSFGCSKER